MLNPTSQVVYLFLITLLGTSLSSCISQDNVYRAFIPENQIKWFSKFVENKPEIDTWLSARTFKPNSSLDDFKYYSELQLKTKTPGDLHALVKRLHRHNIKLELIIEDLFQSVNLTSLQSNREKRFVHSSSLKARKNFYKYKSYYEIKRWMVRLAKKYPKLVQISKIGKTFENRPLLILKLTYPPTESQQKPLFFFESGIHAREWLSIASNVYFIEKLIDKFLKKDDTVVRILTKYELHFLPVMNPDGYEFTRGSRVNRFWRKNMRYTKRGSSDVACYGVDLNRNFDYKWMVSGASANPCSEIHAGPYPASEPEVKSVMNYVMNYSPRWVSYISLHTYGAIWLSPYSYSRTHVQENFQETCEKALTAINKIKKEHDFAYKFGAASHELYEASGCGEDWARDVAKINHTFVIELKPEQIEYPQNGFEFPESEVEQAALEVYDGFIEYIKSFFINNVSQEVVDECKLRMITLKASALLQSKGFDDGDFSYDYEYYDRL